ncbi:hypothetical protein CDD83_7195 [Cordyceps sp. RAO-2017]|nr:hypothetical protein CDD83_7195 [Cordyceps sp. RAO-2017]
MEEDLAANSGPGREHGRQRRRRKEEEEEREGRRRRRRKNRGEEDEKEEEEEEEEDEEMREGGYVLAWPDGQGAERRPRVRPTELPRIATAQRPAVTGLLLLVPPAGRP